MPFDPLSAIEDLERSIGVMPAAILAIAFLAGPTLAWLLYRFVVQPRTTRYTETGVEFLWLCPECRSANEFRISRCYRCGLEQSAIAGDLHVIDSDGVIAIAPAEAVSPDPSLAAAAGLAAAGATVPKAARPLVPVGPGKPVASGSPAGSPARTPGTPVGPGKPARARPATDGRAKPSTPKRTRSSTKPAATPVAPTVPGAETPASAAPVRRRVGTSRARTATATATKAATTTAPAPSDDDPSQEA